MAKREIEPEEIFDPEHTGRELPPDMLADWIEFCGKVREKHRATYNTWFENRWGRDRGWGAGHPDMPGWRVTAKRNRNVPGIVIHCPTKTWAEKLDGILRTELSTLRRVRIEARK